METETLYQNEFIVITAEIANKILLVKWEPQTSKMTLSQYKECIQEIVKAYKNPSLQKSLILTNNFNFTVDPETQIWNQAQYENVPPMQKSAFVMPTDFIANLGVEQAIDEINTDALVQYFDTPAKGKKWLLEESTSK